MKAPRLHSSHLVTSTGVYLNSHYNVQMMKYVKTTQKLQLVQNEATQAVMGMPQYTHVTLLLHKLHW